MRRTYRRRCVLVDRFQIRLLAVSIGHIATFGLLLAVALFLPLMMELQDATLTIAEKGRAAEGLLALHTRFWPSAFVVVALIGTHSLLVSHRIAGPLVGFRRILKAVGEGDFSVRARIRRHDYLERDAEHINTMISGLSAQLREVQEEVGKIHAAWTVLAADPNRVSGDDAARRVESFGTQVHALKARVDRFKIGAPDR
jgi:methyl-accepting chemotaxis protein